MKLLNSLFLIILNIYFIICYDIKKPIIYSNYFNNTGNTNSLYLNVDIDINVVIDVFYKFNDTYKHVEYNKFSVEYNKNNSTIVIPQFNQINDIFKNNNHPITFKIQYANDIKPIESDPFTTQSYIYEITKDNEEVNLNGYFFFNNDQKINKILFKNNFNQSIECKIISIKNYQPTTINCKFGKSNNQSIEYFNSNIEIYDNFDQIISNQNITNIIKFNSTNVSPSKSGIGTTFVMDIKEIENHNNNSKNNRKWIPIVLIIPTVSIILIIILAFTIIKRIKDKKKIKEQNYRLNLKKVNKIWNNV